MAMTLFARCFTTASLMALPVISFASTRQLFPEAMESQRLVYEAGSAWIVGSDPLFAAASFEQADSSAIWLGLVIRNDTEAPVTIREQDVSATSDGVVLKVWSAAELIEQQHHKENWRKFAAGLAAGLNAYSAGQQGRYTTSGTFSGSVQSVGATRSTMATFDGTYTASGIDPVARQRAFEVAARQNQELLDRVREQGDLNEQSLNAFVFHSQTIPPSGSVSGHIKIDVPRKSSRPRAVAIIVKTTDGTSLPFFVGLDGAYTDEERFRAAQDYRSAHGQSDANRSLVPKDALSTGDAPAGSKPASVPSEVEAPKERQFATGNSASALPVPPQLLADGPSISVTVLDKKLQPCPSDMASTCVVIDIVWQTDDAISPERRAGKLVLSSSNPATSPLGINWTVPDGLGRGRKIEEHGIEFPLSKAGKAKQWLSTIDATAMRVGYVAGSD